MDSENYAFDYHFAQSQLEKAAALLDSSSDDEDADDVADKPTLTEDIATTSLDDQS